MKKFGYVILAAAVFATTASAQSQYAYLCGYGCSSKILYFSDASETNIVGYETWTCSAPYDPIMTGERTAFEEQLYGSCD